MAELPQKLPQNRIPALQQKRPEYITPVFQCVFLFRAQSVSMNQSLIVATLRQPELGDAAQVLADASQVLNEQLQAAIQEKEYFIAVLSHELRTPLTPVLLAATMLRDDGRLDAEMREMMDMIRRNVTLEARLIDDLLDATRMERGKVILDCRPIDLRNAIEQAIENCKDDLEAGRLTLQVQIGDDPQIINADARRLQQVFSNLLRNSIKFTPAGGHIRFRSRAEGEMYCVNFSDSGVGMDAEFLPKAFGAFEQGSKASVRKGGLGLGLAICKSILDLHGGTIAAQSGGKDKGSTFVVKLPAVVDEKSLQWKKNSFGFRPAAIHPAAANFSGRRPRRFRRADAIISHSGRSLGPLGKRRGRRAQAKLHA